MPRYLSLETEPFGKWKGVPIYLTTIISAVMVAGLILCAFIEAEGSFDLRAAGFFVPRDGWANAITLWIYPLIDRFSFFTPFAIFCFYWWSIGIETHLGRKVLSQLVILLIAVPAAASTLVAYSLNSPDILLGNFYLAAGMIVAFSTLYPNALAFGFIPFKYVAVACVFCGSLMMVAEKRFLGLVGLWSTCLAALLFIKHSLDKDFEDSVPLAARVRNAFRRKPKFRVVPRPDSNKTSRPRTAEIPSEPEDAVMAEVDAILEKVARSGLQSLTPSEHARLQKAREELQRRDGH
jgi:hypothetical protein